MQWVTREHVHLDRVASPWLIRRWIDREATFLFITVDPTPDWPEDAIPFGLLGVELSAHDADGSTFRKIMRLHGLDDPGLNLLCEIVEEGIAWFLAGFRGAHRDPAAMRHPEAIGLEALSQGMMYAAADDHDNLEASFPIYDALYARCQAELLFRETPELSRKAATDRIAAVKAVLIDGVQ